MQDRKTNLWLKLRINVHWSKSVVTGVIVQEEGWSVVPGIRPALRPQNYQISAFRFFCKHFWFALKTGIRFSCVWWKSSVVKESYFSFPTHQPAFALEASKSSWPCVYTDSPWFDSEDLHQDPSVYLRRSQAAPQHRCTSAKPPAS